MWATARVGVVKNDAAAARREKPSGKVREMRVQIAACLLNFTRLRALVFRRRLGEDEMWPMAKRISHRLNVTVVYVYVYVL